MILQLNDNGKHPFKSWQNVCDVRRKKKKERKNIVYLFTCATRKNMKATSCIEKVYNIANVLRSCSIHHKHKR